MVEKTLVEYGISVYMVEKTRNREKQFYGHCHHRINLSDWYQVVYMYVFTHLIPTHEALTLSDQTVSRYLFSS